MPVRIVLHLAPTPTPATPGKPVSSSGTDVEKIGEKDKDNKDPMKNEKSEKKGTKDPMKNDKNDKRDPTRNEKNGKNDKDGKKSQQQLGTTKPNGIIKTTKQPPPRSVKYRMRDYLALRKERAEQEARKPKISDLTTEHLEPPFKRFWADLPAATTTTQSNVQCGDGPGAFSESGIPVSPAPTYPQVPIPSLPSSACISNGYRSTPATRDKSVPETDSMSTTPDSDTVMANANDPEARVYYFAYGTDLSITTMVKMYPGTRYVAPATLPNYQWLIGSRNMPIITPSTTEKVNGILYKIPNKHVAKLTACAHKNASAIPAHLTVDLFVDTTKTPANVGWGFGCMGPNIPGQHEALVFVAEGPETKGELKGEEGDKVILGMNRGIVEAKVHGLDSEWSDQVLRKWIPYPKSPVGVWR